MTTPKVLSSTRLVIPLGYHVQPEINGKVFLLSLFYLALAKHLLNLTLMLLHL